METPLSLLGTLPTLPERLLAIQRYLEVVPVRVVFRCEFCDAMPDDETHASLQQQLLDLRHGEYLDADPGAWLPGAAGAAPIGRARSCGWADQGAARPGPDATA